MSAAVFVKSESGDSYLYSFETGESIENIKTVLNADIEMFEPISEYYVNVGCDTSDEVLNSLEMIMHRLFKLSWSDR